ncbi:MAG TPA: proton-conducting transporter membrane subunit [Solirubrobacteraceae bacterium]|jgi:multicomponent Na+:H+ antiporter subunit D|nr:proton-conducting transporter membrane subunit [Solirubrobacteraceae bacterium]
MAVLSSLPVVVPFMLAPLLVAVGAYAPRWSEDALAMVGAVAVLVICLLLAVHAGARPFVYWMGGWRPERGVAIGIAFAIDPLGAGMAAFAAVMVLAALTYSLRYFDAVGGLFHGLMLLFLAGMAGFCLTGDLFDLVVFFELMSAVAYALTAYRIEERAPIQGAINFAVTNSIGGYAMFIAVAMLYARTGQLNMAQIGAALDGHRADPLVIVSMVLLLLGFLTKAAAVPLHFWLADAHAVAPVPVCVLFSGVMVELGIYAVARIYWVIFAGPLAGHAEALRAILVALGVTTALLGAVMCVLQRHIKRLLAFSTISHVGVFVCGVGLLGSKALAGVAAFVVGHGLTKAALFMLCGVLLHRFRTVDEYDLHGRGRELRVAGVLFAAGGLLLAAPPPFTEFQGKSLLESASSGAGFGWLTAVFAVVSALTAGAVLRVGGRVFLGWGPSEGPDPQQARPAHERVDETRDERDHTPPLMLIVPGILLTATIVLGLVPGAIPWLSGAAARFTDHRAYAAWVLHGRTVAWPRVAPSHVSAGDVIIGLLTVAAAVAVAGAGLFGRPAVARLPQGIRVGGGGAVRRLRRLHSGHIGDYIAWWTTGAGVLGGACLLALR